MGRAKEIVVKVIPKKLADDFVRKHHYSGKIDPRSFLHFGVFLDNRLHGAIQLGPSIQKHASILLVEDTEWNGFCEISRIAFDDVLPRNSESRAISIMMRMLKKQAPHLEWVVSYADGAQCGDGSIYRASGFHLIDIKKNNSMWLMPDGKVLCSLVFSASFSPNSKNDQTKQYGKVGEKRSWPAIKFLRSIGAEPIPGFQLKYIYFLNPKAKERLNTPILPFSQIDKMGAGMYKGERITIEQRQAVVA